MLYGFHFTPLLDVDASQTRHDNAFVLVASLVNSFPYSSASRLEGDRARSEDYEVDEQCFDLEVQR